MGLRRLVLKALTAFSGGCVLLLMPSHLYFRALTLGLNSSPRVKEFVMVGVSQVKFLN